MRLPARAVRRVHACAQDDDGVTLLEVIVSLLIIAVVMSAAAGFFLNSLRTTNGAASRQAAITVASQELENIRTVPPKSLLAGRIPRSGIPNDPRSVTTAFAYSGAVALTSFDDLTASGGVTNTDPNSPPASTATVPTMTTQSVSGTLYTLYNFIDPCWVSVSNASYTDVTKLACGAQYSASTSTSTTSMLYRVTVAASWTGGASTDCAGGCAYSASSLVDPNKDPVFQSLVSTLAITGVSPSTIGAGATKTITVSGNGFAAGVSLSGCSQLVSAAVVASTVTATSFQASVTAGTIPTTKCQLVITNPDGGSAISNLALTSPPQISGISPTSIQNYTSPTITLSGTGFNSPKISSGSGSWTTPTVTGGVTSAQTMTATYTANAANTASLGTVPVTVTNQDGGSAPSSVTVTQSQPIIKTASPASVVAGQSTPITLTGTDFAPSGETVNATGGTVSGYSYGAGFVTVIFLADGSTTAATLSVRNPDGGISVTKGVTVTKSTPTLSTITGKISGSAILVTLTGTGFTAKPSLPTVIVNSCFIYNGQQYCQQSFNGTVSAVTGATTATFSGSSNGAGAGNYPVTVTFTNADGGTVQQNMTLVLS